MRKDKVPRAGIKSLGVRKILADGMIREMSGATQDALLDDPRIRTDLEHIQIVIGFKQQTIGVAEMHFDKLGHVAKIGHEGHLCAIGPKGETYRVGRVVRNLKRVDINIADGEVLPGLNRFQAAQTLREPIRQGAVQRVHGGFGDVKWRLPQTEHLRQAVAVVGMLVSDEDAVDTVDAQFDGRETRKSFAFAEATVHKESGALRLEQGDVARAA